MQDSITGFVGIIIGLLGIFIGILLFLITKILGGLDVLKEDVRALRENLERIRERPILFSPNLYLTALAREAKFWERLNIQRAEKIVIANKITTNYIQEGEIVIVDSGTTVDQIPHILREKLIKTRVYTNNLLAAISVIPPIEGCDCYLLSGRVDPIYGATYDIEHIAEPLNPIRANKIVLACTSISFEQGPMVNVKDYSNLQFKKELVRKALEEYGSPRLIIAVDWTKFQEGVVKDGTEELNAVLDLSTWKAVKSTQRFVLVTTNPPASLETPDSVMALEEMQKFLNNMDQGGMKVEICRM